MADNNENKVLNVPLLRFPEFTDEWKESVLSDFVERVKRKNKNNLCKLPLTISAQYGLVDQISFFNKVIASENMSNYYLLHKGDFAYNKSYSSEYPWGAIKRLDCYEQGTLSSLYICFKPYSHVSSDFLTHYFETSKWHQGISEIAVEGARNHGLLNVGIQDFFETRHCLPQSLLEQEKIAKFLNLIEERIATQNKIIEKYESLIKGIAQNVARNNKPNIRLSECLECSSSTLQESDVCENGTYPVYGANGIVGYLDNYNAEKEAVYIIKDGSGVGTVSYVTGKCSATGTLNTLQAKEGYSLQYLYYMLKVFNFEPYKTGMAIPHIYFKDYGKAKIFCPSYTEQLKYVGVLSTIDNKLSAEQSILTDLSLQKQYLLHQMFI
ncbi:restriction endonuclease subunit S [Bacteroides fragilis]|uniref:restriction endonuclease subunit S n=1 Tax=Bacteroides fragilis TaxID=817 RepID=UPI0034A46CBB